MVEISSESDTLPTQPSKYINHKGHLLQNQINPLQNSVSSPKMLPMNIHIKFIGIKSLEGIDQPIKINYFKTMMSVPRSVLPANPQKNQRLQYPVYGEFGYLEPVGRKKYQTKHSPIHQIIFNHDLPTTNNNPRYNQSMINNTQFARNNSYLSNSRSNSSALGVYSQQHSPEIQKGRYSPQKDRIYQYGRLQRQYSERPNKVGELTRVYNSQNEEQSSGLSDSRTNNHRNYPGKKDSLDLLLNPLKGYQEYSPKSKEKTLDSLIKHRARNPTFLNSQV